MQVEFALLIWRPPRIKQGENLFKGVNLRYLKWLVMMTSTLFPVAAFAMPKGAGTSFYLLFLCGVIGIACRIQPAGKPFSRLFKEYWPLHLAMSGMAFALLMHQAFSGGFSVNAYELPLQLASFPLLFWILLLGQGAQLRQIQWGMAAGAVACVVALYWETAQGALRPDLVLDVPLVPLTNMMLMLGVLSLLSIGWNKRTEKVAIALKIAAGSAALYGSYLSLTRSGWVALPVFLLIGLAVFRKRRLHEKLALLALAVTLFASAYIFSDAVRGRFDVAQSDLEQYVSGENKNTSLGQRLQLLRGAMILIRENPLFGIGRDNYRESVQLLVERGVVTQFAATQPHTHNDLLFQATSLGVFGLFAMLALYFVPAFYFFRDIRHADDETRTIAGMGLALTLGFFIVGLSDTMFYWRISYAFYVVLLAVFFACLDKRKSLLEGRHSG